MVVISGGDGIDENGNMIDDDADDFDGGKND